MLIEIDSCQPSLGVDVTTYSTSFPHHKKWYVTPYCGCNIKDTTENVKCVFEWYPKKFATVKWPEYVIIGATLRAKYGKSMGAYILYTGPIDTGQNNRLIHYTYLFSTKSERQHH